MAIQKNVVQDNFFSSSSKGGANIREHWCEQIKTIDINGNTMWASCDPFENECNGGSSIARVDDDEYLWTSTNDNLRSNLEWVDNSGFDDWIKIKYGKIDAATRDKIWKGCVSSTIPCVGKTMRNLKIWVTQKTKVRMMLIQIVTASMRFWIISSCKDLRGSLILMTKPTNNGDVNF